MASRVRNWCWTWNNPVVDYSAKENLDHILRTCKNVAYMIGGMEIAPTTQRKHMQGYVIYKNAVGLPGIKKQFPDEVHFEMAKGDAAANIAYCSKDGDFAEHGDRPVGQGTRTDLENLKKRVLEEDRDVSEIIGEINNPQQLKFAEGLQKYRKNQKRGKTQVIWCYGETGTGKTTWAYDTYGYDIYTHNGTKWFDGYSGQKVALFDDFRPDWFKWDYLLKLLDNFPLRVEVKGSTVVWKPETIVITTPYDPHMTFYGIQAENIAQLVRRVTEVKQFPLAALDLNEEHTSENTEVGGNTKPRLRCFEEITEESDMEMCDDELINYWIE